MTQPSAKPVSLRIRLPFETEQAFIERYGSNVVRGGIFIATRAIKPEGTPLVFQLVLADGSPLLRGTGTVAKSQVDEGGARAGMTIRFGQLDAESLARVERILAYRNGAKPAAEPQKPAPRPEPPKAAESAPAKTEPEPPEPGERGPTSENSPAQAEPGPTSENPPAQAEPGLASENPPAQAERAPAPQPEREAVLGIELDGDLLFVACSADPDPRPLALLGGRLEVPALVAQDPAGTWHVGHAARALPESAPRQWLRSPETPAAAAAHLLEAIRTAAEARIRQPVNAVVFALAASTEPPLRERLDAAARLAGFQTVRHLQGPTAAAQAFTHGKALARKRVLVLTWHEEALEVSLVVATGEDLEVVACFGDRKLGTLALDAQLAADLSGATESPSRAWREAVTSARARMREGDLSTLRLEHGDRPLLTREKVEALVAGVLERALPEVQRVLEAAGTTAEGVDELVFLGESWSEPKARAWLEQLLRREHPERPVPPPNPRGTAATGAALFGHALAERAKGRHTGRISEVLPWPVSLALRDGNVLRILEARTRLPAEKSLSFRGDPARETTLAFFLGTALDEANALGAVSGPPPTGPGEVEVHLKLDEDGRASAVLSVPGAKPIEGPLKRSDRPLDSLVDAAPEPEACGVSRPRESSGLLRRLFGKKR